MIYVHIYCYNSWAKPPFVFVLQQAQELILRQKTQNINQGDAS